MSETITEFLLARITEDEAVAKAAQGFAHLDGGQSGAGHWKVDWTGMRFPEKAVADYAAHHDPARILAECAAKRAIIEHCRTLEAKVFNDDLWNVDEHDDILQSLASVYSDHPDYQQEWAA